jgi:hypothetical protein
MSSTTMMMSASKPPPMYISDLLSRRPFRQAG